MLERGREPRFLFMPAKSDAVTLDLASLRARVTELVARNAIAMVQCAIDGVKEEGQYQAIKYLFEMVGLYPAPAGTEGNADETFAQILLQRLGLEEQAISLDTPKC